MLAEDLKIKYRVGTMAKSPLNMGPEEYKNWQIQGEKEIREYLFSIGQPLVNIIDGVTIIEYSDGTIEKQ